MDAAMNVGGDFYDFYLLDEGHLVVTIADVSGKGVPAALFMAKSQSVLKNCVLREKNQDNLAAAVERANQQLCRNNDTAMFVTVFIGVLDIQNGHFTYVNGGHCPPLLGRHEHYDFLPMKKCCVLGVMDMPYEQQSIDFLPGDTLYLYTDGVSEAMDEQGTQFTERQIKEKLNHLPKLSIEDILGKMREFVQQHAGTAPQSDDITMLGLRYYGNAGKPQ
ncbi:PP2C family protein-serine/threonine phosphatase [Selenomonas ruminantium]|uniref:PP2C family protein-serine/threonine phosphatase n=1 Tax=Selenomonas ruminantium TaxID=971 RepID=UPI0026F03922|nr:PP2C family protein-serine/threonine phosphatase [Selenomonas ruminantium]